MGRVGRILRLLADLATLARGGVVALVLLRVGEGPEALAGVVRLLLLVWTLDALDGWLARASRRPSPLSTTPRNWPRRPLGKRSSGPFSCFFCMEGVFKGGGVYGGCGPPGFRAPGKPPLAFFPTSAED